MPPASWTASPYGKEDLPAIESFFKRVYQGYGSHGTAAYFQWKIADNPEGPGFINLVRTPEGIGSVTSLTPKALFVRGEKLPAAEIGDTFTDAAYQRQGMFSLLINQTRQDGNRAGIGFIYGTPNSQSQPGYERNAGFRQISGIQVESLYFPVHIGPALRRRLPALFSSPAAFAWRLAVKCWLRARDLVDAGGGWDIVEVDQLPDDWTDFWEEARSSSDFLLSRSAAYLHWRYFEGPYRYRVLVARSSGRIRSYLVYRLVEDETMPSLRIADYLSATGEESALPRLLAFALRAALAAGAVKVSAWCPASNAHLRRFRSYGFLRDGGIPVICHDDDVARKVQERCRSWHFSIGDSDNV